MQKWKFHHIGKALHISVLIDILHGQDALGVIGEIDFCLDQLLGALSTVANCGLFILVDRDLDIGRVARLAGELGGDPRVVGIFQKDKGFLLSHLDEV